MTFLLSSYSTSGKKKRDISLAKSKIAGKICVFIRHKRVGCDLTKLYNV